MAPLQIRTPSDLDRIVLQLKLPESDSLEYKESLVLGTKKQREELLKDLSGMANGGFGVIVFGVSKDDTHPELPKSITPLTDRGLVGRLEDIVRDGIRPPLLVQFFIIEYPPGFVLAAMVMRSPLGPYMVEAGQDRRYYLRTGSRTAPVPMRESQVRDLYALAGRDREQRQAVWAKHSLPIPPATDASWLILSAVPEEPLVDLIDPLLHPAHFRIPESLREFSDYARAGFFSDLKVWAEGYFAEFPSPGSAFIFRLHRDGAIGWATEIAGRFGPWFPRVLHAQLLCLDWLWDMVRVRTPLELHIEVAKVEAGSFNVPPYRTEAAARPHGITRQLDVSMTRILLPGDLARAGLRHGLVRDFQSRLRNAFGVPRHQPPMFEIGYLVGPDGRLTGLYLARNGILTRNGDMPARLEESCRLVSSRTGQLIGFVDGGVVLDDGGNAVAAVELAVGSGLPDDFLTRQFVEDVTMAPHGAGDRPNPVTGPEILTSPTKRWSQKSLSDLLR